jgi:hypothetical protein
MDQEQFAHYLGQGLGRPHLWLREHDSAPYSAALLHACLYNPRYDPQCEGSRATYLYELLQLTSDPQWFRQQLLDALAQPDEDMATDQLLDFAGLYARAGDTAARELLYQQSAAYAASGDPIGAEALIALDGIAGFLFITNRLGEAMQSDDDAWDTDYWFEQLEETAGPVDITALHQAALEAYPFAAGYLDQIPAIRERQRPAVQPTPHQPYLKLKQQIAGGKRVPFPQLRRWGRDASDEQIEQAARDLLQQTDRRRLAQYLEIFRKRVFPLGYEPLLPLVWHDDERVARWSIQAISQVQHPVVRELGFTLLEARRYMSNTLDIFVHHYQPGDERYLAALLTQTTDQDQLHDLGSGLSDVFAAHPSPAAAEIFLDLYERGPCALCRDHIARRLIEINHMPEWLIVEGLHDANFEVRAAISAYLQAQQPA